MGWVRKEVAENVSLDLATLEMKKLPKLYDDICMLSTLQRRSDFCVPRNETVRPRSQYPRSCICERFTYSHNPFTYFAAIGRSIVNIYESLTDTWMWDLGTRLHSFISGNICFKFLEQCLCSVVNYCMISTIKFHAFNPPWDRRQCHWARECCRSRHL